MNGKAVPQLHDGDVNVQGLSAYTREIGGGIALDGGPCARKSPLCAAGLLDDCEFEAFEEPLIHPVDGDWIAARTKQLLAAVAKKVKWLSAQQRDTG